MDPPIFDLLGPPELKRSDHPSKNHHTTLIPTYEYPPPLGKDSEGQRSSLWRLYPCLVFFFQAITYPDSLRRPKDLAYSAERAWQIAPFDTLHLIFCLRMMRKPNIEGFYKSLLWVHKNHPSTLALNLMIFGGFGWFKELLEILNRVLEDSIYGLANTKKDEQESYYWMWGSYDSSQKKEEKKAPAEIATNISKAKIAIERYENDINYRKLHDRISDLFADFLRSDLKFLESGETAKLSFASKFCPSIDSSYDKATLICKNIARRIFPRHEFAEYKDVEEAHYAYRVRHRLRKQVLVPLRKALKSSSVNNAVERKKFKNLKALNCLETYCQIYKQNHAIERKCSSDDKELRESRSVLFKLYMKIVDRLGIRIGDGLKLPHQVIAFLNNTQGSDEIAELQWQKLVQELSNKGKLRNCLAVCDISLSMIGTDKEMACIAMGVLISELSENPWKGMVFSFTDFPKLYEIEGDNLRSKCEFMRQMECDEKVDCLEIYNRVLDIAITQKLSHIRMPKRIFVFTYKDFVEAFKYDWLDDYTEAYNSYRKRGFEFNVPELVFWNLKDSIAEPEVIYSPVKENQKVGMIITGFSSNLLRLFLKGEADSRSYAAQFQAPYGIDLESVPKLVPKVEDVFDCAVPREELESLLVFD
ncbi:hypothetical protein M0R45_007623 [Rubus argutus]|uniref:Uncharacterized protein n=1 Tax=Rubus argutus TaxID=59490 RepID=A0AAW1XZ97_RUBAR